MGQEASQAWMLQNMESAQGSPVLGLVQKETSHAESLQLYVGHRGATCSKGHSTGLKTGANGTSESSPVAEKRAHPGRVLTLQRQDNGRAMEDSPSRIWKLANEGSPA